MALTNVAMWTNKGWKSVTVDEAISLFPYNKVSANSGIFMCRLCKKYVTLTAPGIYSRCFKHSRGDVDKECNDRVLSSTISQFEMHNFIPPIRIEIKSLKLFSLEMGFILPPDINNPKGVIEIKSNDLISNVAIYDISRLNYDCLTYLKIGSTPSERYLIKCDNEQIHLSTIVDGISASLQKIKEAQIIFYQKYCQLLDRIASLSSVQQYDDAQKILHIISACINRTPFEMYSAHELKSAVLEAMHQFKEAASIPGLTPERMEQISIHEKEYKIVLHQNDIEEAQTYYSQREYEKSLISISKGLQTASEKTLWQLLENIVNEYASIDNGYLFEQLEKIILSAQGSEEYRALLFNKASNICRNEALNEYDQQNYQKCLHTIRYAMNKVFDVRNWEIVNKIAENTDLDDISFIDELVNTTNSFQGVFDCSNVEDILFERFWTKAEESYVSMNYVSSIVLLSNAMHYKNDSKIFDLLSKIIAEHDSTETESLFSLINGKILISNISDSERTFLAEKMTKRLLSVAKENLDKNDYSEALKHIRIAADSCRTTECYQLYALIVEAYASEENGYLNSDVNKILEYANTTVFPAEIDNMLKNLNNQYQSAAFKSVCEKLKYGYDIEAIDSFDCLKQTDEYGMTVAMYAALYKNTEAIKYIAKKYGNPTEYEQKNILGLDFGTIICYSYSNVPDSILELFSWYVDAKKEMDDTDEWLHKRNKELDTQLNRLKLELSKARLQKNYQLLEECQDAASKIHDAKDGESKKHCVFQTAGS